MKRRLPIILFTLVFILLATSCTASTSAPAASTAPASAAATPTADTGLKLPAGDKPVLKQLCLNQAVDYNTYPVAADIEKLTGYKVQYDMLPADNPMDKLNMIMASQEDYDIVTIGADVGRVIEYANEGALVDINPYLQYAPYLNAAINDYERSTFTIDNGLYAIGMSSPEINGRGEVRMLMFVRQDWLDALNLKMPATVDDLTNVLRAFKTYDNGTGTKTIPLTLNGANVSIDGLMGAFGLPNEWNEVNGKLVYRGADPRWKDYLAYLKSLYQEGLLDAEFPANKAADVNQKYSTGIAGMSYFGFWDCPTLFDAMAKTQPNQKTSFIAPLVGPNGDVGIGSKIGSYDRITFLPKAGKNIEHTINFLNLKLETEIFKVLSIGIEGVHYTVKKGANGQDEYWPILPTFFDDRGQANNFSTGRYADIYNNQFYPCRARKDERQYACWDYMNNTPEIQAVNVTSEVNKAPAFPFTSKNKQALDQSLLDEAIKIIAGTNTVDSYDAFIQDWLANGGQTMIDEYNTWWADFKK